MINYQVIVDEEALRSFLFDYLPKCSENETYYFCLFARSKYAKNEDGSNKFPHIKTDKAQLKRFVATPDWAMQKIKQLECAFGSYLTKDGDPVPQEALALYVNPNPRSQKKATFKMIKRMIDILECQGQGFNIATEALSAIQKSKSYTYRVDFDIDTKDVDLSLIEKFLPREYFDILETRGGYHILVNARGTKSTAAKDWYQRIKGLYPIDQVGDNMIPVPGTYQGGFTPKFI